MPAGGNTPGMQRYRARIKAGVDEVRNLPKRDFEDFEDEVEWIADAEGTIQQMQVTKRACVLTLSIPIAYAQDVIKVQQFQGSVVFFRFFLPPDPFVDDDAYSPPDDGDDDES